MIRTSLALALLATIHSAAADPATDRLTRSGIDAFRKAYQAWDAAGFTTAAAHFQKAAERAPGAYQNHYWRGVALFHHMLHLRNQDPPHEKEAARSMSQAIESLETAVKLHPRDAESHALLGTLYGMRIHGGLLRAIRFGPRVQEHQREALAHGARNPRVRYLLGAAQFHTAKNRAGYIEALETLQAAEKMFATEAAQTRRPPTAPRWGASSCLTFIGRTYLALGERKHAAEYFRRALAAHPNDHIARQELDKLNAD